MSGSSRAIVLSLSVRDADVVRQQLLSMGQVGEQVMQRLDAAAKRISTPTGGIGGIPRAANDAGTSVRGMGQTVQQAGFQLQDFAVQVQGGTSALTALSQQGSQFLGMFGPAGAVAGVVLAVGAVGAQLLIGRDAQKQFNDRLEQARDLYNAVIQAAQQHDRSLQQQAETLLLLRDRYGQLNQERREYEGRQASARHGELEQEARRIAAQVDSALERIRVGARAMLAEEQQQERRARLSGQEFTPFAQGAREALAAFLEFRATVAEAPTAVGPALERLTERMRAVATEGGAFARQAATAVPVLDRLVPDVDKLQEGLGRVNVILQALGISLPGVAGGINQAGNAAAQAAAQVSGLAAEMERLRRNTLANPAQSLDDEIARARARADAMLGPGGSAARFRGVVEIERQAEEADAARRRAEQEFRRRMESTGVRGPELDALTRQNEPTFMSRAMELAQQNARAREAERRASEAEQAERRRETEARSAARRAASAGAAAERREYGATERILGPARVSEAELAAAREGIRAQQDAAIAAQALNAANRVAREGTEQNRRLQAEYTEVLRKRRDAELELRDIEANRNFGDQIELLQRQVQLQGESVDVRERELAVLREIQRIEGAGGDRNNLTPEQRQRVENARTVAVLNQTLARSKDLQGELERIGEGIADRLTDALTAPWKEGETAAERFGTVATAVLNDLAKELIRLAIINPLKNAVFGQTNATAGSIWDYLFSSGAGAAKSPTYSGGTFGETVAFTGTGAKFADGGVMTSRGPLPLRRYAGGGIATSPQLAMFGEGATPEAYVPLPDGRAIPVRMQGQGGITQYINIDARGADAGVRTQIRAAVAIATQQAQAELLAKANRGGPVAKQLGRRAA